MTLEHPRECKNVKERVRRTTDNNLQKLICAGHLDKVPKTKLGWGLAARYSFYIWGFEV